MTLHETLEYFAPTLSGSVWVLVLGLGLGAILTFISLRKNK